LLGKTFYYVIADFIIIEAIEIRKRKFKRNVGIGIDGSNVFPQ
jgi:hypothetical protein